jgi:hypothetical protein
MVQELLNIAAQAANGYLEPMSRLLPHPTREQIELPAVMDCLSDPIRLAIVYNLAKKEGEFGELR